MVPCRYPMTRISRATAEPGTAMLHPHDHPAHPAKHEFLLPPGEFTPPQALHAARKHAAALEAQYHEARQAVLALVREQLDAVDASFVEQLQSAADDSVVAEKAVRELVLKLERNVALAGIKVSYSPGRVS